MLLLGVDSRTRQIDGRTDTIMFVTIDPNTGKVSMASLPRDMVLVPIAPGKTFGSGYTRINALFAYLGGFGGGRKAQFKRMVTAMEYMSGIEIDRYAMIGFYGVRNLVNNIGGVDVTLAKPLIDNSHARAHEGRHGSQAQGRQEPPDRATWRSPSPAPVTPTATTSAAADSSSSSWRRSRRSSGRARGTAQARRPLPGRSQDRHRLRGRTRAPGARLAGQAQQLQEHHPGSQQVRRAG